MVDICTGESVHVTSVDIATGATTMLPNPDDGHQRGVSALRPMPGGGGLLWLSPLLSSDPAYPGTTLLVRWDGSSANALTVIPDVAYGLVVAGEQVFVQTKDTLYQYTFGDTGTPPAVASIVGTFRFVGMGTGSSAVFYTLDGSTLTRRDVASGVEQTLATGINGQSDGTGDFMWADEDWVYFVDTDNDLARVSVTGGTVEAVSPPDEMRDGVNGVVTDACNVYWLAAPSFELSTPPVVYVRAR